MSSPYKINFHNYFTEIPTANIITYSVQYDCINYVTTNKIIFNAALTYCCILTLKQDATNCKLFHNQVCNRKAKHILHVEKLNHTKILVTCTRCPKTILELVKMLAKVTSTLLIFKIICLRRYTVDSSL